MPAPRVDILLPVWRARRTLPSAVGDLIAQHGVDLRILAVVDTDPDGRDDGSLAWLESAARREPRLKVLRGLGTGPGPALDLALATVTAPFTAMMEADDRCAHDRLMRQFDFWDALSRSSIAAAADADSSAGADVMAVVTRAGQIGARTPGMRRYLDWQNSLTHPSSLAAERFIEIPALFQTGLYRTKALHTAGGFTARGDWPIDIDFWFRWFEQGLTVQKLPRVLYQWRQHARQSTRSGGQHDLSSMRACKLDALQRLHGRRGARPRPILFVSTGKTLDVWRRELRATDLEVRDTFDWKPGRPLPKVNRDEMLLVAAYGSPAARDKLRAALGHPAEPEALLFTA